MLEFCDIEVGARLTSKQGYTQGRVVEVDKSTGSFGVEYDNSHSTVFFTAEQSEEFYVGAINDAAVKLGLGALNPAGPSHSLSVRVLLSNETSSKKIPEIQTQVSESKKHDQGKPLMSLLPPNAKEEIAKVLTFGANKYGMHNWNKTGFSYTRLLSACERHLTSFEKGENLDPESGISHLAHAACNLMFLLEQLNNGKGTDDRINS